MVLGLFEHAVDPAATIETHAHPGDRLLIYTDGLTERFNAEEEMLGIDGLAQIVRDTSTLPLILSRVSAWSGGPPADDVSLVLVEFP